MRINDIQFGRYYIHIILIGFLLLTVGMPASAVAEERTEAKDVMADLIEELGKQGEYAAAKEARIRSLKDALAESKSTQATFRLTKDIFSEYVSYQSDSAYRYAAMMRRLSNDARDA